MNTLANVCVCICNLEMNEYFRAYRPVLELFLFPHVPFLDPNSFLCLPLLKR